MRQTTLLRACWIVIIWVKLRWVLATYTYFIVFLVVCPSYVKNTNFVYGINNIRDFFICVILKWILIHHSECKRNKDYLTKKWVKYFDINCPGGYKRRAPLWFLHFMACMNYDLLSVYITMVMLKDMKPRNWEYVNISLPQQFWRQ